MKDFLLKLNSYNVPDNLLKQKIKTDIDLVITLKQIEIHLLKKELERLKSIVSIKNNED